MKVIDYFYKKYPEIIDNSGCISIRELGNLINIYNNLEKEGNYESIKLLGLTDIKDDLKFIGYNTLKEYYIDLRIKKLNRILK